MPDDIEYGYPVTTVEPTQIIIPTFTPTPEVAHSLVPSVVYYTTGEITTCDQALKVAETKEVVKTQQIYVTEVRITPTDYPAGGSSAHAELAAGFIACMLFVFFTFIYYAIKERIGNE